MQSGGAHFQSGIDSFSNTALVESRLKVIHKISHPFVREKVVSWNIFRGSEYSFKCVLTNPCTKLQTLAKYIHFLASIQDGPRPR